MITCDNIDSIEFIPGYTEPHELDTLYTYAASIDWGGTPEQKHIAMLIRDLITFHGNACKQISECASVSTSIFDDLNNELEG